MALGKPYISSAIVQSRPLFSVKCMFLFSFTKNGNNFKNGLFGGWVVIHIEYKLDVNKCVRQFIFQLTRKEIYLFLYMPA